MDLFIKTSHGRTISIDAELSDKIDIIKSKLGLKLKVRKEFIILIWAGKELRSKIKTPNTELNLDELTLSDYNYTWKDHSIYARIYYNLIKKYNNLKLITAKNRLSYALLLKYNRTLPIYIFNPDIMDDTPIKYLSNNIVINNHLKIITQNLFKQKYKKLFFENDIHENHVCTKLCLEINNLKIELDIFNQLKSSDTDSPL